MYNNKMSEITLYNTLRKIDGVTEAEAKEAVTEITSSKNVATKTDIAALKETLTWRIVIAIGVAAGVASAIVKLL